jgi:predicted amidohydrolase YtcJ
VTKNRRCHFVISNGTIAPLVMGNGNDTIELTLESDDILGVADERLREVRAVRTIVAGRTVFTA